MEQTRTSYYDPGVKMYNPMAGQLAEGGRSFGDKSFDVNSVETYKPMKVDSFAKDRVGNSQLYKVKTFTRVSFYRKQKAYLRKEARLRTYRPMARVKSAGRGGCNLSAGDLLGGNLFIKIVKNIGATINRWSELLNKIIPWKR